MGAPETGGGRLRRGARCPHLVALKFSFAKWPLRGPTTLLWCNADGRQHQNNIAICPTVAIYMPDEISILSGFKQPNRQRVLQI